MRLSCAFVSRILGSRVASEPMPHWVIRHLSCCDKCRAEAETTRKLSELLKASAPDCGLDLTWHRLRATLPEREGRVARKAPALAMAAAAVVVIAAVCFGLSTHKGKPARQVVTSDRSGTQRSAQPGPEQVPKAERVVQQPEEATQQPTVSHARYEQRPRLPRLAPRPEAAPKEKLTQPDSPSTMVVRPEAPEAPSSPEYTVVAAEEHVIDVIGVDSAADSADSDTHYVIQTTDTGDEGQVVLL